MTDTTKLIQSDLEQLILEQSVFCLDYDCPAFCEVGHGCIECGANYFAEVLTVE